MQHEPEEVKFDYFQLYGNFTHPEFLGSLGITEPQQEVLKLLVTQCTDEKRHLFVPDLIIEALVGDKNTPYETLRTLHILKEQRIIFYELAETLPVADKSHLTDKVQEEIRAWTTPETHESLQHKANASGKTVQDKKGLTVHPSLGAQLRHAKPYDRYAMLNVEYPAVFFCLQEEAKFHNDDWKASILPMLYAAIRQNKLAMALTKGGFLAMLEFIQYVQSIFGQPLIGTDTGEMITEPVEMPRAIESGIEDARSENPNGV